MQRQFLVGRQSPKYSSHFGFSIPFEDEQKDPCLKQMTRKQQLKYIKKLKTMQLRAISVGFDRVFHFLGVLSIAAMNIAFNICDLWLGLEVAVDHDLANWRTPPTMDGLK